MSPGEHPPSRTRLSCGSAGVGIARSNGSVLTRGVLNPVRGAPITARVPSSTASQPALIGHARGGPFMLPGRTLSAANYQNLEVARLG